MSFKFHTMMLAKSHFDPSGGRVVGRIRIPTPKTEWHAPTPGELALLENDGGAVAGRLGHCIATEDGYAFWSFVALPATSETAQKMLGEFAPAYSEQTDPNLLPFWKRKHQRGDQGFDLIRAGFTQATEHLAYERWCEDRGVTRWPEGELAT